MNYLDSVANFIQVTLIATTEYFDFVSCGTNMAYRRLCHSYTSHTSKFLCKAITPCQCQSGYAGKNVNGTNVCEPKVKKQ